MPNEKNLVPFNERTESEQRRIASEGGVSSGKARRRKRDIKAKMKLLLSLPAADNDKAEMEAMGIDPEDMDNEMVLVKAMFLSAANGDTRAFDRIMDLLGKTVAREELELKKREAKRKDMPLDKTAANNLLEQIEASTKALEDEEDELREIQPETADQYELVEDETVSDP